MLTAPTALPRLLILALLMAAAGCLGAWADRTGDDAQTRLVVTGSSTLAPLVGEMARRFEAAHPGTRVDVQSGGSARGISDVRDRVADIGMVSRDLLDEEDDLDSFPIARDGVGVIVHADNPVVGLTLEQLRALYSRRVASWSEVGGRGRLVLVSKAAGRATLEVFARALKLAPADLAADVIIGENEQAVKMVASNAGAIAYVSIGTARQDISLGAPVRLLPVDGVEPDLEAVASGRYPIQRPLHLVAARDRTALVRRFLDHASSAAVADLIHGFDFVPPSN